MIEKVIVKAKKLKEGKKNCLNKDQCDDSKDQSDEKIEEINEWEGNFTSNHSIIMKKVEQSFHRKEIYFFPFANILPFNYSFVCSLFKQPCFLTTIPLFTILCSTRSKRQVHFYLLQKAHELNLLKTINFERFLYSILLLNYPYLILMNYAE